MGNLHRNSTFSFIFQFSSPVQRKFCLLVRKECRWLWFLIFVWPIIIVSSINVIDSIPNLIFLQKTRKNAKYRDGRNKTTLSTIWRYILMCVRKHVHFSVHRPFSIRTAKERKFSGSRKCDRAKGKKMHMVSQRIYHQFFPIYPLTPIGKNKKDIKLKELTIRRI